MKGKTMKKINSFLVVSILFLMSHFVLEAQHFNDLIILKGNSKIRGYIHNSVNSEGVRITDVYGKEIVVNPYLITEVHYGYFEGKPLGWDGDIVAELGANFGTPSIFNVTGALHSKRLVFRSSLMFLGRWMKGVQIETGIKIYKTSNVYHSINAVVGFLEYESNVGSLISSNFGGIAWNMNLYGFNTQLGFALHSEEKTIPLLFQIGYAYPFKSW